MPDELTWFKWEAYTTWLSGFALLVIVYYLGAELYLIDTSVLELSAAGPANIAPHADRVDIKAAHNAILTRCSMCHRNEPVWPGVHAPPKGVVLDDADTIRRHARLIELNAVRSNAMPPGNITAMTAQERQLIAAWIEAGAPNP